MVEREKKSGGPWIKAVVLFIILTVVFTGILIFMLPAPENRPPRAVISVSKTHAEVMEEILFNGSRSSDDKGITRYKWDFGDGSKHDGVVVAHKYASNNRFTVDLTVTDSDGATGSTIVTIYVTLPDDGLVIDVYPPNALVNDTVTFNATRSERLSDITSYLWDFGDGQAVNNMSTVARHGYSSSGFYNISLTVGYQDGTLGSGVASVGIYKPDPRIRNCSCLVSSSAYGPDGLDPASASENEVLQNVYETPVTYDRERADRFVPLLLERMPEISADGKNYTMELRKGVQFASGREMKADDAVDSFTRMVIMGIAGGSLEMVTTNFVAQYIDHPIQNWINDTDAWNRGARPPQYLIDALGGKDPSLNITNDDVTKVAGAAIYKVDDFTFKVRLTKPFTPFTSILATSVATIVDSQVVKDKCGGVQAQVPCDYMSKNAVAGTGPYVVNEGKWDGAKVIMDQNPNWWREKQQGYKRYIPKVIIRIDSNYNFMLSLLKNGDIDSSAVAWANKAELEAISILRVISGMPTFDMQFLALNENITNTSGMSIPADFFADKEVRKAFAYAFPYEEYINDSLYGGGIVPQGPIPKGMFGFREDPTKMYKYDLAKAEEHFKNVDGGKLWSDGFDLTLYYNQGNTAREKVCNMLKSSIEKINPKFHVTSQGLDWPAYLMKSKNKELPLLYRGWSESGGYADPDGIARFLHSNGTRSFNYSNPAMDKLIDQAEVEQNVTKRADLYAQLQDLDFDDPPYTWIAQNTAIHVESVYVVGYYYNPMLQGGTYWAYLMGVP